MDTITIAAVAKVVTDYLLKISGWLKLSIPGFAVHFLVVSVTTGIMYGYTKSQGLPFNWMEAIKGSFSAIGLDQFVNHISANTPTTTPAAGVTVRP